MSYKPIRDYGVIGNLRSAALVAKNGSVDWAPVPFLDSPSVFAAILDSEQGGFWRISPVEVAESEQEYVEETNILVTRFRTPSGTTEVIDWLPADLSGEGAYEIHRKVVCVEGRCEVESVFAPRFDYARGATALEKVEGGVRAVHEKAGGVLASRADWEVRGGEARAQFSLKKGQERYFTFCHNVSAVPDKTDEQYERDMQRTRQFWASWVHRCDLDSCPAAGPWHELVVRSTLVLKILFVEPPGSIAAAATTSLPEEIGGVRNWDYRFSWIRDSAFTLQALFWMGYVKEARAYVDWILRDCCGVGGKSPERLRVLYGLRAESGVGEEILPHLEGYKGSKPVRIGNGAFEQNQWDIYGSILDTVWRLHRLRPSEPAVGKEGWEQLKGFADYVAEVWREPDEGLWEVRGGRRQFTYSKMMCWVALDRACRLAAEYGLEGDLELWAREGEEIRRSILERGWSEERQSFVQSFDGDAIDASLLLFPVMGFVEGKDPKMLSTIERVERELSLGGGLFRRYTAQDGLPGKEGAFLLASFWMVDALVAAGEQDRAKELFSRVLGYANHLGLYSEEMDEKTKGFLGNFPQAYTHVGLINSAFYISGSKRVSNGASYCEKDEPAVH